MKKIFALTVLILSLAGARGASAGELGVYANLPLVPGVRLALADTRCAPLPNAAFYPGGYAWRYGRWVQLERIRRIDRLERFENGVGFHRF